jgi:hypothetical protein
MCDMAIVAVKHVNRSGRSYFTYYGIIDGGFSKGIPLRK